MASKGFMDLGKKYSPMATVEAKPKKEPKIHYPSCYVSDVEGLDVEDGDDVVLKGKVTSCTTTSRDGKTSYSCEIEVNGLKVDGKSLKADSGAGLDSALDKIEEKKSKVQDDDNGGE